MEPPLSDILQALLSLAGRRDSRNGKTERKKEKDARSPGVAGGVGSEEAEEAVVGVKVVGEGCAGEDELELLESMAGEGRKRHGGARCAAREV